VAGHTFALTACPAIEHAFAGDGQIGGGTGAGTKEQPREPIGGAICWTYRGFPYM
jgi:hypothetical protein